MASLMATAATALALLTTPALAQEATTPESRPAAGGTQAHESAMQNAQSVGIRDVRVVEGAFVLEGSPASGQPVLLIVAPSGALVGIATPMPATGAASADADATPAPGEPAQSGYMATQTSPASPQMWDPAAVENAMQGLELGRAGAAGEVAPPAAPQ